MASPVLDALMAGMAPAVYEHPLPGGGALHFRYKAAAAEDLIEYGAAVFLLSQGVGPIIQGMEGAKKAGRSEVSEMIRLVKRYGAVSMREPEVQVTALLAAGVTAVGAEGPDGELVWDEVTLTVYGDRVDREASPPVLAVGVIPKAARKPLAAAIDALSEGEGVGHTLRRFRGGPAAGGDAVGADGGDAGGDADDAAEGDDPGQGAVPAREPAPAPAGG